MDTGAAIRFIEENGNEVEKARLRFFMTGELSSSEIVQQLLAGQRHDGGWAPPWVADYSSLDATCFRLAQAETLGVGTEAPPVIRAVSFLIRRQARDGAWEEDKDVGTLAPAWATPGKPAPRLYLTANCGFWLAALSSPDRTPDDSDPAFESAMRAGKVLLTAQEENGGLPSFLHTHWLASALWYWLGFNSAADSILEALADRIEDLDAGDLAWMINCLKKAGVPEYEAPYDPAAIRLEKLQADDGRWRSGDGPAFDVHATLEALRAFKSLGEL